MIEGSNIDELGRTITDMAKRQVVVQTCWATVKSVDWDKKTMVATGLTDDLDYNDVLLGIGVCYYKPKASAKCLLGTVENQNPATYLIWASEMEEITIDADSIVINGGQNKGIPIVDNVVSKLNALENDINNLKDLLNTSLTTVQTEPGNGANSVFQTFMKTQFENYYGQKFTTTKTADLENTKVKH